MEPRRTVAVAAVALACALAGPIAHAQPAKKPADAKGSRPAAPEPAKPRHPATEPAKPRNATPEPAKPATPPDTGAWSAKHTSALVRIAHELVTSLGEVPTGATVVVSPLATDVAASKPDELSARVASLVAGRMGTAHAHPEPASLAVARGISGRGSTLVYVKIEIAKGEIRATGDLYPLISNGWDRLRNPVPEPRAHAFAHTAIDAEIRSFLSPVLLEQAKIHKAKSDDGGILAVGCGDVDGDGGVELVLASRTRVSLARLRGGKVVVERSTPWSKLASRVPVPAREPIAAAVVGEPEGKGNVFVGTTDRGGVVVDRELLAREALAGLPVPGLGGAGCAVPRPDTGGFEGVAVACRASMAGAEIGIDAPLASYDAVATLALVDARGGVSMLVGQREPNGKLHLRARSVNDANGAVGANGMAGTTGANGAVSTNGTAGATGVTDVTVDDVGAQVLLADLDLDGHAEVVTTANTASADDEIVVSTLTGDKLTVRLRLPTKSAVRALAACPPEDKGIPALVAAVGSEVWVVR